MIKELLHKRKMEKNTKDNFLETLTWEISSLKTEVALLDMKIRMLSEEIENDRTSKRDITKNENKRTLRGKTSKVCSNKRTTN